ncbi:hypothetical protein [Pantoea piersonii]|nr:hypothetical protein [Pantoea piersonii]
MQNSRTLGACQRDDKQGGKQNDLYDPADSKVSEKIHRGFPGVVIAV